MDWADADEMEKQETSTAAARRYLIFTFVLLP
jgi:hypothetical protein